MFAGAISRIGGSGRAPSPLSVKQRKSALVKRGEAIPLDCDGAPPRVTAASLDRYLAPIPLFGNNFGPPMARPSRCRNAPPVVIDTTRGLRTRSEPPSAPDVFQTDTCRWRHHRRAITCPGNRSAGTRPGCPLRRGYKANASGCNVPISWKSPVHRPWPVVRSSQVSLTVKQ